MPSRIFVNSENSWQSGEGILLSKDQKHYLQKVLRLRDSDPIEVVNKTTKQVFLANLVDTQSSASLLSEIKTPTTPGKLNLIFAFCKSDKNEIIIEKCTELGVDNFIIYQAKHSIAQLNENKIERLEKIAEAASCQSKRNSIPRILTAKNQSELKELMTEFANTESLSLIASLEAIKVPVPNNLINYPTMNVAVGPEGDFTSEEYQLFQELGFLPISLGQNILRAETAAIASIAYLNIQKSQCLAE